jgi:hypothetical protein
MPVTSKLLQKKEWGLWIVSGLVEFGLKAEESTHGIEYWLCGNPRCGILLGLQIDTVPKVSHSSEA